MQMRSLQTGEAGLIGALHTLLSTDRHRWTIGGKEKKLLASSCSFIHTTHLCLFKAFLLNGRYCL